MTGFQKSRYISFAGNFSSTSCECISFIKKNKIKSWLSFNIGKAYPYPQNWYAYVIFQNSILTTLFSTLKNSIIGQKPEIQILPGF